MREWRFPEVKSLTKIIKPSSNEIAGMRALASWTPKSRLLTAQLYPAFQKGGERRDGKAAEGKDEMEEAGDLQSVLGALSITTPALGKERKVPDICGNGKSELVRGWPKVTEQW